MKVRGDYVHRRLNRRGHQLELNGNFSRVVSDLGTSYRLPLRRAREEWLNFDTGFRYENTDTSRSNIFKVGAKHIRRRAGDWFETRFVDVGIEDFDVADESGQSTLVIPGVSWIQRRSFAKRRPDKGHTLTFRVSGSAELLLSEATFLQAEATAKYIRPLWAGARVIGRGDVGFTATDDFDSLPASVRYFAGGDTRVRGYEFESLGPGNAEAPGGKAPPSPHRPACGSPVAAWQAALA